MYLLSFHIKSSLVYCRRRPFGEYFCFSFYDFLCCVNEEFRAGIWLQVLESGVGLDMSPEWILIPGRLASIVRGIRSAGPRLNIVLKHRAHQCTELGTSLDGRSDCPRHIHNTCQKTTMEIYEQFSNKIQMFMTFYENPCLGISEYQPKSVRMIGRWGLTQQTYSLQSLKVAR